MDLLPALLFAMGDTGFGRLGIDAAFGLHVVQGDVAPTPGVKVDRFEKLALLVVFLLRMVDIELAIDDRLVELALDNPPTLKVAGLEVEHDTRFLCGHEAWQECADQREYRHGCHAQDGCHRRSRRSTKHAKHEGLQIVSRPGISLLG